jgi:hypothetical protein
VTRRGAALAVGTALIVAGAVMVARGGGDPSAPDPAPPAADSARARGIPLCGPLRVRELGAVEAEAAEELSGLVLSRTRSGVLWTHNDSGDDPRLLAIAPDGRLLAEFDVTGADHDDWEDIAVARDGMLYVGDIGDNDGNRDEIVVYGVPEPRVVGGAAPSAIAPARRLILRYPDGAHDAEALLVDPRSGALVIVTKSYRGNGGVYVSRRRTTTLRRAGGVRLGFGQPVTAGDVSADGRTIVLRTYDRAFVWKRRSGESVAAALRRRACTADVRLSGEGQGETLALTAGGRAFYTVPEGKSPLVRRYSAAR